MKYNFDQVICDNLAYFYAVGTTFLKILYKLEMYYLWIIKAI